ACRARSPVHSFAKRYCDGGARFATRRRAVRSVSMRTGCLLCLALIVSAGTGIAAADPLSELSSFSIFDKVDLVQLAKSDAKAAKWQRGNGALSGAGGDFWIGVLAARARAFSSGGTSAQPPYDHAGPAVRPGDELNGLLREQPKIRKQFAGLLESTGIGRGAGSLKPDLYWELLNADDLAVATLGAFYSRNAGGNVQAADTFYYASGGDYVTLTLHQI